MFYLSAFRVLLQLIMDCFANFHHINCPINTKYSTTWLLDLGGYIYPSVPAAFKELESGAESPWET